MGTCPSVQNLRRYPLSSTHSRLLLEQATFVGDRLFKLNVQRPARRFLWAIDLNLAIVSASNESRNFKSEAPRGFYGYVGCQSENLQIEPPIPIEFRRQVIRLWESPEVQTRLDSWAYHATSVLNSLVLYRTAQAVAQNLLGLGAEPLLDSVFPPQLPTPYWNRILVRGVRTARINAQLVGYFWGTDGLEYLLDKLPEAAPRQDFPSPAQSGSDSDSFAPPDFASDLPQLASGGYSPLPLTPVLPGDTFSTPPVAERGRYAYSGQILLNSECSNRQVGEVRSGEIELEGLTVEVGAGLFFSENPAVFCPYKMVLVDGAPTPLPNWSAGWESLTLSRLS